MASGRIPPHGEPADETSGPFVPSVPKPGSKVASARSHLAPEDSIGIVGDPEPGQVLFGRYLVEKQIGAGGMGSVWLVRNLELGGLLDTPRALKLINKGIAFDPQAQARFKREVQVMGRLTHPCAVVVHYAQMARDAAFIEMEYIRGQSLNNLISKGTPVPWLWVATILEQLCDVLQEAHEQKIVHRDLKPSNLMLVDGRPPGKELLKVLDFGIAKIVGADDTNTLVTHPDCFLGTVQYASPEQHISPEQVDGRSDLYSAGVLLYELLTGCRPFDGPMTKLIYDHLNTQPPRFSERSCEVEVPLAIERLVLSCLAKNPNDRPQTANELAASFREATAGLRSVHRQEPFLAQGSLPAAEDLELAKTNPHYQAVAPHSRAPAPLLTATLEQKTAPRRNPAATWKWPVAILVVSALVAAVLAGRSKRVPLATSPPGYAAENQGDLVHGWPRALIRASDHARFVRIEGGLFQMGSLGNAFDPSGRATDEDRPAHAVKLSDYYIQETEVTNGELDTYFEQNRVETDRRPLRWRSAREAIDKEGRDPKRFPAVGISHDLAERVAASVGGRLPTEAQWEFAARSRGKLNRYAWGNEPMPNLKYANIDSVGDNGSVPTSVVGSFPRDRTAEGILDLTGNVREWCRDTWARYEDAATPLRDPTGPPSHEKGASFVIRGGSFACWPDKVFTTRPRHADKDDPSDLAAKQLAEDGASTELGFRVVIEWPPKAQ